jgi:hypothetical protein
MEIAWLSMLMDLFQFIVTDPMIISGLFEFLQGQLVSDSTKQPSCLDTLLNDSKHFSGDLFSKLPPELLHLVLSNLPIRDIMASRTASPAILRATYDDNHFWKTRIAQDMPWFWELNELVEVCRSGENERWLDCKRLYFWLRKTTGTWLYSDGPFLGLVNRSRIWKDCEYVGQLYRAKLLEGEAIAGSG